MTRGLALLIAIGAVLSAAPHAGAIPTASQPWRWHVAELPGQAGHASGANSIARRPGLLVVVGSDFESFSGSPVGAAWTSTDGGRRWSRHLVPQALAGLGGVVMLNGRFIAHADNGWWNSLDGADWRQFSTPGAGSDVVGMRRGLGGLVFVGQKSEGPSATLQMWLSPNGIHWRAVPDRTGFHDFCSPRFAASPTRVVVIGTTCSTGRTAALVSSGGETWLRTSPILMNPGPIGYGDGTFVVVSGFPYRDDRVDSTAFWVSADGIIWYRRPFVAPPFEWECPYPGGSPFTFSDVAGVRDRWVAVGKVEGNGMDCHMTAWTSTDLVHWTREMRYATGDRMGLADVVFDGSRAIAVGGWSDFITEEGVAQVWTAP